MDYPVFGSSPVFEVAYLQWPRLELGLVLESTIVGTPGTGAFLILPRAVCGSPDHTLYVVIIRI